MRAWLRTLVVAGALFGAGLATIRQSIVPGGYIDPDFIARYAGGEVVGEGRSPYDDDIVVEREEELGGGVRPVYDAPPVLVAFRLLSWLPLGAASFVFELASLASCVVIGRVLTSGSSRTAWAVACASMLVFSPTRHALLLGQIDLLVLAVVLVVGRWQPAAAILKPQTTGLLALALFAGRPSRAQWGRPLLGAAAGGAVVVAVSAGLAPSAPWIEWWYHLGDRGSLSDGTSLQVAAALAGVLVLVAGLVRSRGAWSTLDELALAGTITILLAVMGGWNPQWCIGLCVPLGAVLLATRRGDVVLRRHHQVLLVVAVGCSMGGALTSRAEYTVQSVGVPVASVACLAVAVVLLRWVPTVPAAGVVAVNGIATYAHLQNPERLALAMLVAVILLHLLLDLRPTPLHRQALALP